MKIFQLMSLNRGLPGGIVAPTLKMFKRDVVPAMFQILRENHISFDFNKQDMTYHFPDTNTDLYVFHGEDDGFSIRGPNLAFMAINEVTLITKNTFDAAIGRVRLRDAKLPQIAISGTPEGFNWSYDFFIENPREDTDLIYGNTRENMYLSDRYVKHLESSYDKLMQEQYIDGKFVNLKNARAAWAFDRFKHVKTGIQREAGLPVWVSVDFNVDNMAATFWNPMGIDSRVRLRAFADVRIQSSNTEELGRYIRDQVGIDNVVLFPDPAGNQRRTNASQTDIQILRDAGFQDIRYKKSIVSVRACLNALNNMLDKGDVEIGVQCKNLIADLEQCTMKANGTEIDKSKMERTHWLDGAKDMIDYEFPIIKQNAKVSTVRYA